MLTLASRLARISVNSVRWPPPFPLSKEKSFYRCRSVHDVNAGFRRLYSLRTSSCSNSSQRLSICKAHHRDAKAEFFQQLPAFPSFGRQLLEEGFAGVKKTLNMSYASCSTLLVSNTTYIEPIHMHIRKAEI